jgi:hypothetical protein
LEGAQTRDAEVRRRQKVADWKQAVAIALNEARRAEAKISKKK